MTDQTPRPSPSSGGPVPRMPGQSKQDKAVTYQRLHQLKTRIAIASVLGFGALAGLAVQHHVGVTATATAATAATASSPAASAPSGQGFFDQGNTDDNQGGYSFGQGSTSQAPVTGSSVS